MKSLVDVLILRLIVLGSILLVLGLCTKALAFDLMTLDELSVDYKNYKLLNPNNRPLLIYPEHAKEGLALDMNTDVLKYGYWDSRIESYTTEGQYRSIGLEMKLGVRITDFLQVGAYHHSQHILDRAPTFVQPFPVEDAIEVKIILFHARPGREAIIK